MINNRGGFTKAINLQRGGVVKSDTVNIPTGLTLMRTGTNTTATNNKLTDSAANFIALGVRPGDIIINNTATSNNMAYVTAVDSATVLSLSISVLWALNNSYDLYSSGDLGYGNTMGCSLYVNGTGIVRVLTVGGDDITFQAVPVNTILPVQVVRLFQTTTTATNIVALW